MTGVACVLSMIDKEGREIYRVCQRILQGRLSFTGASAFLVPIIMISSDNASKGLRKDAFSSINCTISVRRSVMPEPGRTRKTVYKVHATPGE